MTAIVKLPWRVTGLGLGLALDAAAAVYPKGADTLVRQLFAGVPQTLASLTGGVSWADGQDNAGNPVAGPRSNYEAQAVTSKLVFEYLGNAGNSGPLTATVSQPYDSRYPGGRPANSPVQYGFRRMHTLTIVGGKAYFGKAYAEGPPSTGYFNLDDIQTNRYYQTPPQADVLTQATTLSCSDGSLLFNAGYDGFNLKQYFVYAVSVATGERVTRSAGVSYKVGHGVTYGSAILPGARITGIACSGNYLYLALANNTVKVYNKTTFALVRTVSYYKPVALASDAAGDLILSYKVKGAVGPLVKAPPALVFGQPGFQANQVRANAFDDNTGTSYRSAEYNGYLGIYLGENFVPTQVRVMALGGAEAKAGNVIQGSIGAGRFGIFDQTMVLDNLLTIRRGLDPSTGKAYTTPDPLPAAGQWTTYNLANTEELRYLRLLQTNEYLVLTGLQVWGYHTNDTYVTERLAVAADGSLTPRGVQYVGPQRPMAIAVTPDNARVSIMSGGADQVVFHFDRNTGASQGHLGMLGGHNTNAVAAANRFYFDDPYGNLIENYDLGTALAYQPDGKLWVGDNGNECVKRFSKEGVYEAEVAYTSKFYSSCVDPTGATAKALNVLVESKQLRVDATRKPVAWVRTFNWGALLPKGIYTAPANMTTLRNGRRYCLVVEDGNSVEKTTHLCEMTAAGQLRDTGLPLLPKTELEPTGNLIRKVLAGKGGQDKVYTSQLTGFDASGNPQYAAEVLDHTGPVLTGDDPQALGNLERTLQGYVKYDPQKANSGGSKLFHLAQYNKGDNAFRVRAAKTLGPGYYGTFPTDGSFDEGGGVNFAGLKVIPLVNSMGLDAYCTVFCGEGRQDSQTLAFGFYAKGQLLKVLTLEARINPAAMAGVVRSATLIQTDADTAYLLYSEEGGRGLCVLKITGLSTIKFVAVPFKQ